MARLSAAAALLPLALGLGPVLRAADEPPVAELLEALARSSATFSVSVRNLSARELLQQKGRQGELEVVRKRGIVHKEQNAVLKLPDDFIEHQVVSDYGFGSVGDAGFHEIRHIVTIDGAPPPEDETPIRHAMTLGADRDADAAMKRALEELEHSQLQGAAMDFGPMLLWFEESRFPHFRFKSGGRKTLAMDDRKEPAVILKYRQTEGEEGLAEFRDRSEIRHAAEGQIWFRESDLLPLRITLAVEEEITEKSILRNEAEVNYRPTPFGLAPATVAHRQFLNDDLLVENLFSYSEYKGKPLVP